VQSPLVVVFLVVIALSALLQAAFIGALALGVRMGRRKLDLLEAQFESEVVPQIRSAAKLTDRAAALSERSLAQARRVDGMLADASVRTERYLDAATARFGSAVERTALRVDDHVSARLARAADHPLLRKLSSAVAVARGVQRALAVWQAAAANDGADEYDEDDPYDDGAPETPGDPSPA
jgi:hypothetical protein